MNDPMQEDQERPLRLARVGSLSIAIPEEAIQTIVEWREPTPLPFAPDTILGVVCLEGRMLTVLDTAKLLDVDLSSRKFIAVLRGKEQLALAIDDTDVAGHVPAGEVQTPPESARHLIKGTIMRGQERVHLLNLNELFGAAIQGYERRRRRF